MKKTFSVVVMLMMTMTVMAYEDVLFVKSGDANVSLNDGRATFVGVALWGINNSMGGAIITGNIVVKEATTNNEVSNIRIDREKGGGTSVSESKCISSGFVKLAKAVMETVKMNKE
ncbi:MAG: hypothetical protein ACI4B3_05190 [Prevotella sp.]